MAVPLHDGGDGVCSPLQAALNMLTKCLALEYGDSGILCVSVDPGCVTPPLGWGTVSDKRCTATLAQQSPGDTPSLGHSSLYLPSLPGELHHSSKKPILGSPPKKILFPS